MAGKETTTSESQSSTSDRVYASQTCVTSEGYDRQAEALVELSLSSEPSSGRHNTPDAQAQMNSSSHDREGDIEQALPCTPGQQHGYPPGDQAGNTEGQPRSFASPQQPTHTLTVGRDTEQVLAPASQQQPNLPSGMDGDIEQALGRTSQREGAPCCWICLCGAEEGELTVPCKCVALYSHPRCLARWQLHQHGKDEESTCRFCKAPLPAWTNTLSNPHKRLLKLQRRQQQSLELQQQLEREQQLLQQQQQQQAAVGTRRGLCMLITCTIIIVVVFAAILTVFALRFANRI